MREWAALVAVAGALIVAAPAAADTVGGSQVVTDPAAETEPDATPAAADVATDLPVATDAAEQPAADDGPEPPPPPPDATGRRGELHVLSQAATASSTPARPAAATPARASRRALPFTGVDAGALALIGLALLAAGSGLLFVLSGRLGSSSA